ncbi:MAG: hypothetical protein U0935_03030 [Pirellulales bacterium]
MAARGPARNGWSPSSATAPTTWSSATRQRAPLPGRGHSSPIVVGERIYLTTADTRQQIHTALLLERATGRQASVVDVSQGGFPARNHPKNTEATCNAGL